MTLAALVLFAGCSSDADDETPSNYPSDNVIRVTTHVATPILTRGSDSDFIEDGDEDDDDDNNSASSTTGGLTEFGIIILPESGTEEFTYWNRLFQYSEDDGWAPQGGDLHWQSKKTSYQYIVAYNPTANVDGDKISYNLAKENIDLLRADVTTGKTGKTPEALLEDGVLNLKFEHMFSQFRVEVELGNALYQGIYDGDLPLTAVTISDAAGEGTFNLLSGEIENDDLNQASAVTIPLTLDVNNEDNVAASPVRDGKMFTEYACITPGAQDITVRLTINGSTYLYTHKLSSADTGYKAGYSYTLKVKVGASSVNGEGVSVSPWNDATPEDDSNKLTTY
jgi:hypothetical protein